MLIGGSVEYERISNKLTSLEPIICQEEKYLEKQIERIVSKRASLILVEGGVSRVAALLLQNRNVKIALNVKSSALQRISRATGADIVSASDAQIVEQNLGHCSMFGQRTVKLKDGSSKLLLVFSDCPEDLGCTLLIQSKDERELHTVKRILKCFITIFYSNRLECAYLTAFNVRPIIKTSDCMVCETRKEAEVDENKTKFEKAVSSACLSPSPFIEFEAPFLETAKGKKCPLISYFKHPLYRLRSSADMTASAKPASATEDHETARVLERHDFGKCLDGSALFGRYSSFCSLAGVSFRKKLKRNYKRQTTEKKESSKQLRAKDVLDPRLHQRIAVLFGSFSRKSPNAPYFCVRPWVVSMQYYGDHDMTLGEFLTKYCFNKSYECPSQNCEVSMLEHSRKLVLSRVCIEIATQLMPESEVLTDLNASCKKIVAWQNCSKCNFSSKMTKMDETAYHLSFARFIDYLSNSCYATNDFLGNPKDECDHCFFHEKTQFFGLENIVTSFKSVAINPYGVVFSPIICHAKLLNSSKKELIEDLNRLSKLALEVCEQTNRQLANLDESFSSAISIFKGLVKSTMTYAMETRSFAKDLISQDETVISTNDNTFIQGTEMLMKVRELAHSLISQWNEKISQADRTPRKITEEIINFEWPPGKFEKMENPFPAHLHLSIPLQPRVGVVVRDIQDSKGNYKPDIGSIIAYALSSAAYEEPSILDMTDSSVGHDKTDQSDIHESDILKSTHHLDVEFQDDTSSYFVKVFYAKQFRELRELLFAGGENSFIRSISQTTFWTPQGGKSGSFFYRTKDERFVVKQMSRFEIQSFVKFAPNYFDYLTTAATENKLTTLCKVYGVFRIGYKSKSTQLKVDILVMEYLFYDHNVSKVWDLKGSLRNRLATTGKTSSDLVLLDENFVNDLWNQQLYILPHSKAALNQAISNDSHFLSSQSVMDYSLLVGVDDDNGELILGIVDYMRTYTLDKKLESWVKIVAIPGAHLPTILSPEMYCARFSEAIDSYFPVVPDQWTGLGTNNEEEDLSEALYEFQVQFGQSAPSSVPKTFIRADIVEGNKSIAKPEDSGNKLYTPASNLKLPASNVSANDFEGAKKLAAAKARRMLEEAAKAKNMPVPKVVAPKTAPPMQRPPRPGANRSQQKAKMSNLEMFKQELERVQEDREKRNSFRNNLSSVGLDISAINKIVPPLDKPYNTGGEFAEDPYTTNVYISNLSHSATKMDLLLSFGSFGPLASVKILYPKNEEENRRPFICAFVAFMSRADVDRVLQLTKVLIIRDVAVRIALGRPIAIPAKPYYVPSALKKLQIPDAPTNLPFNARPLLNDAVRFLQDFGGFPPINEFPGQDHPAHEAYYKMLRNATVRVVIPTDRRLLRLINRMAVYVVTEGPIFEAMIMKQEFKNPIFRFLYNNHHPAHTYYRWKIFSLMQGDTETLWRKEKFRMFDEGSWWLPPTPTNDLYQVMPKSLYYTSCIRTNPERWCGVKKIEEKKIEPEITESPEKKRMLIKDKNLMSRKNRRRLESKLRELVPEQKKIGEAMVWCIEHAQFSKEICECLYESLTLDETPLNKKIARLYLINDILANCAVRNIRDVFYFRVHFETLLDKIFAALGKTYRNIPSRLKQEQFKQRVIRCFQCWEDSAIYSVDKLIRSQNIFLGLIQTEKTSRNGATSPDADIDGYPIDDDLDGVPIEDLPAESTSVAWNFAKSFKPLEKDREEETKDFKELREGNASKRKEEDIVNEPQSSIYISSKWDAETTENSTEVKAEVKPEPEAGNVSFDVKSRAPSSNSVEAMTLADQLEADNDPRAKEKDKEKEKTKEKTKEREKEKAKEKESSRDREKKRDRDRSREHNRSHRREHERDSRDSERHHGKNQKRHLEHSERRSGHDSDPEDGFEYYYGAKDETKRQRK
ncbi:unnamed protein product [Caenorhabditis auriculariae]|uniref:1-phosphatidylinositol-3-phosphate 5-kinase n=1 Tax=Caenorhabditis auriculariae TaxID=2777116 RepID=A0A8S1GZV1_9PELO|nr:unnamed protein product [Caenorhabditis auriculariae]